jgi:hypothetical protein
MNEPQASISHPSHDEFAALLEESLTTTALQEGNVVKGTIVGIEKDVAVIDVGLKTEGRIPLKEFGISGRPANLSVGDEVDVYLERVENAMGEAVKGGYGGGIPVAAFWTASVGEAIGRGAGELSAENWNDRCLKLKRI